MRIAITAGHNIYNGKYFDPGATNPPLTEADIVKQTVALLIPMLERQGHIVLDCTPYNEKFPDNRSSHVERCKRVDKFNADIYIDLHLNAGGGTGVEVWVHNMGSKSVPYATKIAENISKDMNLINRGIKAKPTFWSVSLTSKPALIVEGAFIDNNSDMEKLTPIKYATAIAKAFGEIKVDKPIEVSDKLYRVQVGAYSILEGAEKLLQELNSKGFQGFISETTLGTPTIPKEETNIKSKYYKIGDAHIIETTPDNIEIAILGDNLDKSVGVNGVLFDTKTAPVTDPESCVFIAINDGKALSNNSQFNGWNGPPRATLIYHTNKKLGFRQLKDISTIKDNTIWAVGGFMVKPYMDFKNEQIPSGVNYKTAHTYIGYDVEGKIYLIVKPNHMIADIVPLMDQLKITNAIVLDGGGSSQMNHPGGKYTSTRKINSAILLKQV